MDESALRTLTLGIVLLPLGGAVVTGALGRPLLRGRSHWPVIAGVGAALVASFLLFAAMRSAPVEQRTARVVVYEWIAATADQWFHVAFLVDPLTVVMLLTVTGVSLLVVIYSRDYMRAHGTPERGYERFFAFLGLFVFSMCALVLSGNFLLLYLGWEAVGLCSYLLIGFYYQRPAAAAAAKKAFLVNRIGDFGFGLGILLIYLTFGHLDYHTVFAATRHALDGDTGGLAALLNVDAAAARETAALITDRVAIISLLLFCGAVGKSAQLPLYVWLPDAMEGPSPVSALIHAATMVTAGIYMVVRCGALFAASPAVMMVVAGIGAVTALFAATIALVQTDMKRILAYSTISQLGYMFLGVGVYAAGPAIFHLFTHAFFKALLFLAAGSVMHAMGGIIDLRRFGGLRKLLPWTFATFAIGSLALAGVPFLSGFFSKDEIIHHALREQPVLGAIGLVTALLTAFYTFRMVFRAFFGPTHVPEGVTPHESGPWMLGPLVALSIGAVFAGYFGVEALGKPFHTFLEPSVATFATAHGAGEHLVALSGEAVPAVPAGHTGFWSRYGLAVFSGLLAVIGIGLAALLYLVLPQAPSVLRRQWPGMYGVLLNKYHVDEGYDAAIVRPLRTGGKVCFGLDEYLIDGIVWLVTAVPRALGFVLSGLQHGALQGYAVTMVAGLALVVWLVLHG